MRIDDELLADAKAFAARHGRSLNSVMEDALRQMLNRVTATDERTDVVLPVYGNPNDTPLVDTSPEGLKGLLEEDDIERYGSWGDA